MWWALVPQDTWLGQEVERPEWERRPLELRRTLERTPSQLGLGKSGSEVHPSKFSDISGNKAISLTAPSKPKVH